MVRWCIIIGLEKSCTKTKVCHAQLSVCSCVWERQSYEDSSISSSSFQNTFFCSCVRWIVCSFASIIRSFVDCFVMVVVVLVVFDDCDYCSLVVEIIHCHCYFWCDGGRGCTLSFSIRFYLLSFSMWEETTPFVFLFSKKHQFEIIFIRAFDVSRQNSKSNKHLINSNPNYREQRTNLGLTHSLIFIFEFEVDRFSVLLLDFQLSDSFNHDIDHWTLTGFSQNKKKKPTTLRLHHGHNNRRRVSLPKTLAGYLVRMSLVSIAAGTFHGLQDLATSCYFRNDCECRTRRLVVFGLDGGTNQQQQWQQQQQQLSRRINLSGWYKSIPKGNWPRTKFKAKSISRRNVAEFVWIRVSSSSTPLRADETTGGGRRWWWWRWKWRKW